MAEFGDVMTEFHNLPMPAKLAVGGAVAAVAVIGYARLRAQQASAINTTPNVPSDGPSGFSLNGTGATATSSTPPSTTSTAGLPAAPPLIPPRLLNQPTASGPPHPVVLPIGPARPAPAPSRPSTAAITPAVAASGALAARVHASIAPPAAPRMAQQIRQTLAGGNADVAPKPAPAPQRSAAQVFATLARGARGG